jgi:DNA replication protein DnaC
MAISILLEIMEDRNNKGSIIITSQIPVKGWYEIIGEKTIADAILDRLIHQSHRIELAGESMRRKRKLIE